MDEPSFEADLLGIQSISLPPVELGQQGSAVCQCISSFHTWLDKITQAHLDKPSATLISMQVSLTTYLAQHGTMSMYLLRPSTNDIVSEIQ